MATAFRDGNGVFLVEFMEPRTTITGASHNVTLEKPTKGNTEQAKRNAIITHCHSA